MFFSSTVVLLAIVVSPQKLDQQSQKTITFVEGNRTHQVHFSGQPWKISSSGVTGEGKENNLWLRKGIKAPFTLEATIQLHDQKESAAGVKINNSFFGFEGAIAQELFLRGPVFGGTSDLGKSDKYFPRGTAFRFRIEGTDKATDFYINDKLVVTGKSIRQIDRLEFVPWRSKMYLQSLKVTGDFFDIPLPKAAAYTIPTIDLADEKNRQIQIDREEGQYLGHPTTVLIEDQNTMICVYPKGHGSGPIVMKRSVDAGRSWSQRLPTPKSWSTSKETPTIHRVIDGHGKKRLILFSGLHPIRMSVSEDDGKSWTELKKIGDFGGIVTMSCLECVGPGHYMALFHDDGRFFGKAPAKQRRFTVYKTESQDGGLSWGQPEAIASHATAHLCEPGWIWSPDHKQITVLLRENSRRFNSFMIQSNDNGRTWSNPVELPAALTGDRHTGKYAPDGRLFISFRDTTRQSPTSGDWVAWVGTYDDIASGKEGQYRIRLMDNTKSKDCAYPGVEVLPDGTFVTTTYGHWTAGKPPYIMSVRLKLSEIDAKAKLQTQKSRDIK